MSRFRRPTMRSAVLAVIGVLLVGAPAVAEPGDTAPQVSTAAPADTAVSPTTGTVPAVTHETPSTSQTAQPQTAPSPTVPSPTAGTTTVPADSASPTRQAPQSTASSAASAASAAVPTPPRQQRAAPAALAATDLSVTVGAFGALVPGPAAASGSLPAVSVTTWQGQGWSASASSTDFTCPGGVTIPRSQVTYRASAIAGLTRGSGSTGAQTLGSPQVVVASNGSGANGVVETATWTPLLTVAYPDGASICTYSGTITISAY